MLIRFCVLDHLKDIPPGKLADVELHFADGPLAGMKLMGFAVWQGRAGRGLNVTFPARQYSVNGERRSYTLLRPQADPDAQNRVRELILDAYAAHVGGSAPVAYGSVQAVAPAL
jgi:hypothetical protein